MDKELFKKSDRKTRELIKDEAEKSLIGLHSVDDAINSKVSNIVKTLVTLSILSVGYCITSDKINSLFIFCFLCSMLIIGSLIFLYYSLSPKGMAVLGSKPSFFMKETYLQSNENDYDRVLNNRCFSLDKAYETTLEAVRLKSKHFKNFQTFFLIGGVLSLTISLSFHLAHLFLCK